MINKKFFKAVLSGFQKCPPKLSKCPPAEAIVLPCPLFRENVLL